MSTSFECDRNMLSKLDLVGNGSASLRKTLVAWWIEWNINPGSILMTLIVTICHIFDIGGISLLERGVGANKDFEARVNYCSTPLFWRNHIAHLGWRFLGVVQSTVALSFELSWRLIGISSQLWMRSSCIIASDSIGRPLSLNKNLMLLKVMNWRVFLSLNLRSEFWMWFGIGITIICVFGWVEHVLVLLPLRIVTSLSNYTSLRLEVITSALFSGHFYSGGDPLILRKTGHITRHSTHMKMMRGIHNFIFTS